jgi:hypothetical protein
MIFSRRYNYVKAHSCNAVKVYIHSQNSDARIHARRLRVTMHGVLILNRVRVHVHYHFTFMFIFMFIFIFLFIFSFLFMFMCSIIFMQQVHATYSSSMIDMQHRLAAQIKSIMDMDVQQGHGHCSAFLANPQKSGESKSKVRRKDERKMNRKCKIYRCKNGERGKIFTKA